MEIINSCIVGLMRKKIRFLKNKNLITYIHHKTSRIYGMLFLKNSLNFFPNILLSVAKVLSLG